MRKYQIVTAAALACSLGVVAPTAVIATDVDVSNPTIEVTSLTEAAHVADAAALIAAIANSDVAEIVLDANIEVDQALVIERDLTLNLGGLTLSSATTNIRLLDIKKGIVNLTGTGTILTTGTGGVPVRVYGSDDPAATNYTVVTVGKDVTLKTTIDDVYGIFVSFYPATDDTPAIPHAYGVVINIDGTIDAANGPYVNGTIKDTEGNVPVININDGATITANSSDGGAIYAAGYAKWNIGAAALTGKSGLIVKSGEINLTGTTVIANGVEANPDPYGDGFNGTGAAIQVEQNSAYAGKVDISINGGSYTSENSNAILAYTNNQPEDLQQFENLTINGGTFTAAEGQPAINFIQPEDTEATGSVDDKSIVSIKGGEFSSDVSDYLASDSNIEQAEDGSWVVSTPEEVPPVDDGKGEVNPEAPNSGAISAAQHTYFTNASAIWAGVAVLTVAGAIIVTCRRSDKRA